MKMRQGAILAVLVVLALFVVIKVMGSKATEEMTMPIEAFSPVLDSMGDLPEENATNTLDSFWTDMSGSGPAKTDIEAYKEHASQSIDSSGASALNASEFLPQQYNVNWFDKDFNKIKEVDVDTLIDVSHFSNGVDTVGQSLKNPSYDIRGNIPNPKSIISPFLNSSIEPDTNIKSWC